MSAYLILMAMFAVAWSVVGYGVANLCLKMRWNLVGGFLLVALVAIVPVGFAMMVFEHGATQAGMPWTMVFSSLGMIQFSYEVMQISSCAGYLIGALVGAITGLLPHQTEEGKRERSARGRTTWKMIVLGPLSVAVVWALFFLADMRAIDRLKETRQKHLAILETQEEVAPRQVNDAAHVHDSLIISLMQDPNPDWVLKLKQDAAERKIAISTTDSELLKIFLPNFDQTDQVRRYVHRHQEAFEKLRGNVLDAGQEYRHWNPAVARFTAVHALVEVLDNDVDSALLDLQLLGLMQQQSIDARVEDSMDFAEIEAFRYLVFQAFLGHISPVPDNVYQEMLVDMGDLSGAIRRNLKRDLSQAVIRSIDDQLAMSEVKPNEFKAWYRMAAERIIYQENIPNQFARLQQQTNTGFLPTSDRYANSVHAKFPGILVDRSAWVSTSAAFYHCQQATMVWSNHHSRLELTRAIRLVEQHKLKQGTYPSAQEFLMASTSESWSPPFVIGYHTLQQGQFGKVDSAVVFAPTHRQLDDHLALFLGPSVFVLIDNQSRSPAPRQSFMVPTWGTLASVKDPLKLIIPSSTASGSNQPAPMPKD
ncbi:hypothetical protein AB1L30_20920 [Bremerella sp. JC817]|uniref:hypothetical protein n=1 Tax=Bremerella sp. JC817 TaxID=3231756 RepID=UPI00345A652D